MTVLAKLLDKAYEEKTPAELVDAPVAALQGVSDADAEALKKAFGIKTIGDLAKNKHVIAAQTIAHLASLHK
jgi:nucleotidyltransferase/DNA polymerase involved in DNA repair